MCSTLVGGYIAIAARRQIHLLMGLGAGVLLGAVFFDLLHCTTSTESVKLPAG